MSYLLESEKASIRLWTDPASLDDRTLGQLTNIARLPWVFKHVAAMPDVHLGKGATVGSVIAMKDAVSPAAVGVDIGCGMGAFRTNLTLSDLPDSLKEVRKAIERVVPVGKGSHRDPVVGRAGLYLDDNHRVRVEKNLNESRHISRAVLGASQKEKIAKQCGTLGSGNHFIELVHDETQRVWLFLHSGSRNIGKTLADLHIGIARSLAHNEELPDPDLAVFLAGTREMDEYRRDLTWAQEYAFCNRLTMAALVFRALQKGFFEQLKLEESILCHHNYVSEEMHFGSNVLVTRKGAISAARGQMGLIPGSMGTRSFVVRGLGNPDSFHSASHGAGRKMSRNQARREFQIKDLIAQTSGVECRKDGGVLDEIPGAYKDIDAVMANQKDLVEIVHSLKQVICVKG
ncbi:MAG: RtcB family protein [Leptospiraceae bacterium]|nr:RtcB family protein [Leptospiraceae bacterium]